MISKRNQVSANRQQKRADYSADNIRGFHAGMLIMLGVGAAIGIFFILICLSFRHYH